MDAIHARVPPRAFLAAALAALPLGACPATAAPAAAPPPRIAIILAPTAPKLERFAATELSDQLRRLFGAQTQVLAPGKPAAPGASVILLGSPTTNPAVREATPGAWPNLSDQGHLLKSVKWRGRPALVVGGGSPVATLWATYELGHHFGMRYLLTGDFPPAKKPVLKLDGLNTVLEPKLKLRTWRTLNDFAIGPEAWGLADQKRLLKQVAKLKYNRVLLSVYPWQPFVHYEFGGVRKQTATLWYGYRYPIDGETPGRAAFKGAMEFTNPDFAGKTTYEEKLRAGTALATGIIDTAHDLGMSAALTFSPLEFPKEFAAALPGAKTVNGLEGLTVGPGPKQTPEDPTLRALAATQLRAYLKTYPTLDALYLSLPEFPDWIEHHEAAWKRLDQKTGLGKSVTLEQLRIDAANRRLTASGQRGLQALAGNIAALDFLHTLTADATLLKRPDGKPVELHVVQPDPALNPFLDRLLPPHTGALHLFDYTARRVAEHPDLLALVPASKTRSSLILTLADDNVGILPQFATGSLHTLATALRKNGWEGFSSRYWMPGDQNATAYMLSRAAFDPTVTPQSAYQNLITTMCGEGIWERVARGFDKIEQATTLIDRGDLGFAFPVPGMLMKHYTAAPVPAWWKQVKDLYAAANDEMYRGNQRSVVSARPFLLYHAKRLEFAIHYMSGVEAIRLAGQAKAAGNREEQAQQLAKAVEAIYNALSAQAEVARDQSDRGLIAVLTEHGFRPLQKELEAVEDAAKP